MLLKAPKKLIIYKEFKNKLGVIILKKLPYGISNYEELITENYYYVDKTMYIEKLENLPEKRIMFLRPRKFGKTLFTSTLEYYYDINTKDKFEKLFRDTYIGKNPTKLKNSYHILRFNFSGIDTSTVEKTVNGFRNKIINGIEYFVGRYKLDFYINKDDEAESILNNLFIAFRMQRNNAKIYVIIDEYDHFANELLGFKTDNFKELVSKNGKVRKWYEILKEGTETVVDRIFITGVAPITLDSLTSGFNICSNKTKNKNFNEMLGFTKDELISMIQSQKLNLERQNNILPIMKENYDGYNFCLEGKEKLYNSNMCLFFLKEYIEQGEIPNNLVDVNIASDYSKLSGMLNLAKGDKKKEILEKTISGEGFIGKITEKFNPEIGFGDEEFVSMLFYLGYLTISGEKLGMAQLKIPNKIMGEIYSSYFLKIISDESNLQLSGADYSEILEEIALEGKINKFTEIVHKYLNNLSNRDYQRFDEKYIKIIFYCIAMNFNIYWIKSELEVNRKYPDLVLIPRDNEKGYKAVMMEFKYLKKEEKSKIEEVKESAIAQIKEYSEFEEIKAIKDLNKYVVIAVNDEIFVEKV